MSGPRCSVLLGLVLLLVSVGPCRGSTEKLSESQTLLSIILEIVQENKNCTLEASKSLEFFNYPVIFLDGSEVPDNRDHPERQKADGNYESEPTPWHMMTSVTPTETTSEYVKKIFIQHITGPLYFSAQCSTYCERLYNHSKECSTPDQYYKCARLLTLLAVNPKCQKPKELKNCTLEESKSLELFNNPNIPLGKSEVPDNGDNPEWQRA
ncbi:PREDICTED: protein FAM150B-like, partial [Chrysochloris asiatica]|uniref:Protein FAM150B-like n=1 Tax=Chrysochloris asiatica TaxID=185453 RepID=A0A9B0TNK3_CHRAS